MYLQKFIITHTVAKVRKYGPYKNDKTKYISYVNKIVKIDHLMPNSLTGGIAWYIGKITNNRFIFLSNGDLINTKYEMIETSSPVELNLNC